MKYRKLLFLFFTGSFLLFQFGCRIDSEQEKVPDYHTSRISLDWDGTYIGTLPCADCAGIETEITLNADYSYRVKRLYLERSDSTFVTEGSFRWLEDGLRIELINSDSGSWFYQIGENRLFRLDDEGKRITGSLSDLYILEKVETESQ